LYLRWFGIVLALYVLSIGPIAKACRQSGSVPKVLEVIYAPLQALADACEPFERFTDWYIEDVWRADYSDSDED
jgi:hypothetical protein